MGRPGTGTSGLPHSYLAGTGTEARLRIEFIRRKASTEPGIEYYPEFGSGLYDSDFGPATVLFENVTGIDGVWERVVVEDAETVGSARARFGRVRVVSTE